MPNSEWRLKNFALHRESAAPAPGPACGGPAGPARLGRRTPAAGGIRQLGWNAVATDSSRVFSNGVVTGRARQRKRRMAIPGRSPTPLLPGMLRGDAAAVPAGDGGGAKPVCPGGCLRGSGGRHRDRPVSRGFGQLVPGGCLLPATFQRGTGIASPAAISLTNRGRVGVRMPGGIQRTLSWWTDGRPAWRGGKLPPPAKCQPPTAGRSAGPQSSRSS